VDGNIHVLQWTAIHRHGTVIYYPSVIGRRRNGGLLVHQHTGNSLTGGAVSLDSHKPGQNASNGGSKVTQGVVVHPNTSHNGNSVYGVVIGERLSYVRLLEGSSDAMGHQHDNWSRLTKSGSDRTQVGGKNTATGRIVVTGRIYRGRSKGTALNPIHRMSQPRNPTTEPRPRRKSRT